MKEFIEMLLNLIGLPVKIIIEFIKWERYLREFEKENNVTNKTKES